MKSLAIIGTLFAFICSPSLSRHTGINGNQNSTIINAAPKAFPPFTPWIKLFSSPQEFDKSEVIVSGFLGYLDDENVVTLSLSRDTINKKSAEENIIRLHGPHALNYARLVKESKSDHVEGEYIKVQGLLELRKSTTGPSFTIRINDAQFHFDELDEKNAQVNEILKIK